ncbi:MAG TPA: hypothetical protein PKY59_10185 [Pyrinomonadaceae bacterium]|nr:hypothetical protein [Pyrinomonadaceae bacterium]
MKKRKTRTLLRAFFAFICRKNYAANKNIDFTVCQNIKSFYKLAKCCQPRLTGYFRRVSNANRFPISPGDSCFGQAIDELLGGLFYEKL